MSEWISVEDRLPEDSVEVLCHIVSVVADSEIDLGHIVAELKVKAFFEPYSGDNLNDEDIKVTHWMPLPAPPTQDKEKP